MSAPVALATEGALLRGHEDDVALPDALRDAGPDPAWAVWDEDPRLLSMRVDLVRDDAGAVRVLELTEPSLFFAQTTGGETRLAAAVAERAG